MPTRRISSTRPLDQITAFHVELWKTLRAREVSQSSVNGELNMIRGCFSRAVEWGRLLVSPMKAVKPYRVDNRPRRRHASLSRHTGASAMVAACISLRGVQDIGGWSTRRMLERYAHPGGAEMTRAVRMLTAYTTGTKTGTATQDAERDRKTSRAASVEETEITAWRPRRDSNPRSQP